MQARDAPLALAWNVVATCEERQLGEALRIRRGLGPEISAHRLEQGLGRSVLGRLAAASTPGRADLTDADLILAIETVDHCARLLLLSREQRRALPCLKLD